MIEYHKIDNIYERDITTNRLIEGKFRNPVVEVLKDIPWVATEKVDGTNVRVHWDGSSVKIGGRTDNAQMPVPLMEHLQKTFNSDEAKAKWAEKFGTTAVTLYGEGFGGKIQKAGPRYGPTQTFALFDVLINGNWQERGNVEGIGSIFGVPHVPVVPTTLGLGDWVSYIKLKPTSRYGQFEMEGIVVRPAAELKDRTGKRIIVKIKCCDF